VNYLFSQGNHFLGIDRNRQRARYRKGVDQKYLRRRKRKATRRPSMPDESTLAKSKIDANRTCIARMRLVIDCESNNGIVEGAEKMLE